MIYDDLPKDEPHGWKFIGIGPDDKLYFRSARPATSARRPTRTRRSAASTSTAAARKCIARGVRNTVGFDWHPVSKQLYFTDNGRDWLSEDFPEDELNRITKAGEHFGYPFCHQGDFPIRSSAGATRATSS